MEDRLIKGALEEAVNVEFSLWDDSRVNSHVDDVHVLGDEGSALSIIDIDADSECIELSGDLRFKISASVSSWDDGYMYRDSDTKDFVCLATLYEGIEAVVEANVHGYLDLQELLEGDADWDGGVGITSGDITIGAFELASRRSSADDPSWRD